MRFGAFIPQGWKFDLAGIPVENHWETMLLVAKKIEASGFESAWVFDHFHTVGVPTQEVTYEAWSLMAALATATNTVRLGQMCTCNTYRPPSYLAKVAATIDVISNGRLEVGIGAGWYEHEHDGYGYPFLKPKDRIGMLQEGVEVMKAMWTEDVVDYDGRYYNLKGAISQPKPIQEPHIPLWIAGGGEQLTLRVAARYAQYTNFGSTVEQFVHKSKVLADHCEEVGRDFESITRTIDFNFIVAESESEVARKKEWLARHLSRYMGAKAATKQMSFYEDMAGTPEQIVENLRVFGEAGVSLAIGYFPDVAYDTESIDLFAERVIPAMSE